MSVHGYIFKEIDKFGVNLVTFWDRFRTFFYSHKTIFDGLFIGIYAFWQASLLIFSALFPGKILFILAAFLICYDSTVTIERLCMNSRAKQQEGAVARMSERYYEMKGIAGERKLMIRFLLDKFTKKR